MLKNTIGNNIKDQRTFRRWNQQFLADSVNTSRQSVSAYERGESVPDIYLLIRLADLFNISLDDLTGRLYQPA